MEGLLRVSQEFRPHYDPAVDDVCVGVPTITREYGKEWHLDTEEVLLFPV